MSSWQWGVQTGVVDKTRVREEIRGSSGDPQGVEKVSRTRKSVQIEKES